MIIKKDIASKVNLLISNNQSKKKLPPQIKAILKKACSTVLEIEKFKENCEISISFVDNNEIRRLNRVYRNKDASTDVLSFPQIDDNNFVYNEKKEVILGDVVISVETAYSQAKEYNNSIQREITFLTVHSLFHLLGYDHENGETIRRIMRSKEEQVLNILGIIANTGFIEDEFE